MYAFATSLDAVTVYPLYELLVNVTVGYAIAEPTDEVPHVVDDCVTPFNPNLTTLLLFI